MSFIEKLQASLKDKWLDYYLINQSWLRQLSSWVKTSDNGTRPPCLLILGAVSVLEPSLKELLLPFCELNADPAKLVDLLGLNFDPRIELEKRAAEARNSQEAEIIPLLTDTDTDYLNKIREEKVT
jgi:hypothetical protein